MQNSIYLSNNNEFNHTIERLSLAIARAKALTAVGASTDMEEYQGEILNDYFDSVLSYLQEANHACEQLSSFLVSYPHQNLLQVQELHSS